MMSEASATDRNVSVKRKFIDNFVINDIIIEEKSLVLEPR